MRSPVNRTPVNKFRKEVPVNRTVPLTRTECIPVQKTGLDFINVLRTAFTPVVPQSVRTQSSCQYLFTLLGPTSVKAVRRTLMKLTPDVDNFLSDIPFAQLLFIFRRCTQNHINLHGNIGSISSTFYEQLLRQ